MLSSIYMVSWRNVHALLFYFCIINMVVHSLAHFLKLFLLAKWNIPISAALKIVFLSSFIAISSYCHELYATKLNSVYTMCIQNDNKEILQYATCCINYIRETLNREIPFPSNLVVLLSRFYVICKLITKTFFAHIYMLYQYFLLSSSSAY